MTKNKIYFIIITMQDPLLTITNRLAGLLKIPEDKKEAVIANLIALYELMNKKKTIRIKKIKKYGTRLG